MRVPFDFAASSLLYNEHIPSVVRTLFVKSCEHRTKYEWIEAERCALDALEFCRGARDPMGLALARLHLADFYRDVGELGQAMQLCIKAYDAIKGQIGRAQRHNEAVAAYALGLLCELEFFGNAMQALNWYQKALDQFKMVNVTLQETVSYLDVLYDVLVTYFDQDELKTLCFDLHKEHGLSVEYDSSDDKEKTDKVRELVHQLDRLGAVDKFVELGEQQRPHISWKNKDAAGPTTWQKVCQWIEKRSDDIMENRAWRSVFDIWQPESVQAPTAKGCITEDDGILIDGDAFHVHSGDLPDHITGNAYYHFAFPVREDDWAVSGAKVGDYTLIRQQWQVEEKLAQKGQQGAKGKSKPGVFWEPEDGWLLGGFELEADGTVTPSASPPQKIIGGYPADKVKGYVTALLKPSDLASTLSTGSPTLPSDSPSTPSTGSPTLPSDSPSTPSTGSPPPSSADPKELYNKLYDLVGGDKERAGRLVGYERQQTPDASPAELIEMAIGRLVRDRQ